MGPKKKGKGSAGSPTQGGDEGKVGEKISEVDKEWFGIQIKSLEEKLDRRNEKLRLVIDHKEGDVDNHVGLVAFHGFNMHNHPSSKYIMIEFTGGLRRETMN